MKYLQEFFNASIKASFVTHCSTTSENQDLIKITDLIFKKLPYDQIAAIDTNSLSFF
jgi:hypothetical protein